ncbi:hypothetical protein SESBI_26245 [Sesbania bispinosa]|nr:hypothetical protein SESBI_26245 [Sesbania bispinosa]
MSSNNNMEEVHGSTSNASGFIRNIKITALINNLKRVKAICEEVPKKLDLVPTIEEYAVMLGIPIKRDANIYSYKGSHVSMKKVAELIGLPSSQTGFETRGSVQGWKQTFLEDHLKTLAEQGKWDFFKTTFALLIYGLVLFPFTLGVIDQAAMDDFFFYETKGTNPVMAILADTLMSMEICHKKDKGLLRCCNQLLYVWFVTHLYAPGRLGRSAHPFWDFNRIEMPEKTAQQWKDDFARYQGNTSLGYVHEYLWWRNEQRAYTIPVPMEVQHEDPSRALTDMATQMEIMRAQMRLVEEREDRARTEIETLQSQCKKKDELIERQRNEYADANTRLAKRPRNGKEKEVENLSAEVKSCKTK